MYMNVKKHKPPSRERYEEKNPNWTVRMPKELHDVLNAFLKDSNQSRRDFMAIALEKQELNFKRAYTQGYNEGHNIGHTQGQQVGHAKGHETGYAKGYKVGYKDGDKQGYERGRREGIAEGILQGRSQGIEEGYARCLDEWRIWYFCAFCDERMPIKPGSNVHQALIELLRYYRWGHYPECPRRDFYY